MPNKWIGIYPQADNYWRDVLRDLFNNNGAAVAGFSIVSLSLVSQPKTLTVPGPVPGPNPGNAVPGTIAGTRLRYQVHNDVQVHGSTQVDNLVLPGDTVHVVWVGHGASVGGNSRKFAPHYNTQGAQAFLSGKEMALCLYEICLTAAAQRVYPNAVYVLSCNSGNQRVQVNNIANPNHQIPHPDPEQGVRNSAHNTPLAFRAITHLRAMYTVHPPAHNCTVYAPTTNMMGMQIRHMALPPNLQQNHLVTQVI